MHVYSYLNVFEKGHLDDSYKATRCGAESGTC